MSCTSDLYTSQLICLFQLSFGNKFNEYATTFANARIAVGVAMFFALLIHYFSFIIIYINKKGNEDEFFHVERVFIVFSAANLFSYGLVQGGVFHAVFAWFALIALALIHLPALKPDSAYQKQKMKLWLGFYFVMAIWYWGLIIDFYNTWSDVK